MNPANGVLLDLGEAYLPALLDAIPTRAALVDRTQHYRYANAEYAAFFGWDAAAIPGVALSAVTGVLAVDQARFYSDRTLAGETSIFDGWFTYAKQGTRFIQSAQSDAAEPGWSVLIVDDEPEVASVLAQMLTRRHYRCTVANGGSAALARLEDGAFDAVLCDLHMPEVDGPAVFAWLAAHRPALCARIAFVTGDTLGHAASQFLAQCECPVLEKPFRPDEVVRLLDRLRG